MPLDFQTQTRPLYLVVLCLVMSKLWLVASVWPISPFDVANLTCLLIDYYLFIFTLILILPESTQGLFLKCSETWLNAALLFTVYMVRWAFGGFFVVEQRKQAFIKGWTLVRCCTKK